MYKTGSEQEKEKKGVVSHDPTGETEHRFVVLYNVCRRVAIFSSVKELYWQENHDKEKLAEFTSDGKNADHGWLGLSPRKANNIFRPPGSCTAFREDSTVTKTELICAKT